MPPFGDLAVSPGRDHRRRQERDPREEAEHHDRQVVPNQGRAGFQSFLDTGRRCNARRVRRARRCRPAAPPARTTARRSSTTTSRPSPHSRGRGPGEPGAGEALPDQPRHDHQQHDRDARPAPSPGSPTRSPPPAPSDRRGGPAPGEGPENREDPDRDRQVEERIHDRKPPHDRLHQTRREDDRTVDPDARSRPAMRFAYPRVAPMAIVASADGKRSASVPTPSTLASAAAIQKYSGG